MQTIDEILAEGRLTTVQKRTIKKALEKVKRPYETIGLKIFRAGTNSSISSIIENANGRTVDVVTVTEEVSTITIPELVGIPTGSIVVFYTANKTDTKVSWSQRFPNTNIIDLVVNANGEAEETVYLDIRIYDIEKS